MDDLLFGDRAIHLIRGAAAGVQLDGVCASFRTTQVIAVELQIVG
jgi:hypothetical protein